ncbi:MAG: polysaccharide deacetylase family protein, partial [Thermodesulfobacteriota bacterium]|nr:polysaccharide deacetylase family protein [Thermodesulfobacteriota bacterium]
FFLKHFSSYKIDWLINELELEKSDQNGSANLQAIINSLKNLSFDDRDVIIKKISDILFKTGNNTKEVIQMFYSITKEQLIKLAQQGIVFGGHTHTHTILSSMPFSKAKEDIITNKRILEKLIDKSCSFFAYPNGRACDFKNEHKKILKTAGYNAAFSLTQKRSYIQKDLLDISRININPEDTISSLSFHCTGIIPSLDIIRYFFK